MSVTIAAIPAVPGVDAPAPVSMAERALPVVVTTLQDSAISGMPQLANPAALASELFASLRGYVERGQNLQRATRSMHSLGTDAGDAPVVLASLTDEQQVDLHRGPAREPLDSVDTGVSTSPAVRLSLDQLHRAMDLALASVNYATETALVTRGTGQIVHSANTLLRGQ